MRVSPSVFKAQMMSVELLGEAWIRKLEQKKDSTGQEWTQGGKAERERKTDQEENPTSAQP